MLQRGVAIEARSLYKSYRDRRVVENLNFLIREGECYALLGPDGAGKSSVFRMIYGGSPISQGEIFVLGLNVRRNVSAVKARVGIVPQEDDLDPDFTSMDNLRTFARYYRIAPKQTETRSRELLRSMNLEDYDDVSVANLSKGVKRRLSIARALIHEPSVLILDEPTSGLDSQTQGIIWKLLLKLKAKGMTLVFSTNNVDEAEQIADRVAIMDRGRVLNESTPQRLIAEQIGKEVVEFFCRPDEVNYLLSRVKDRYEYQILPNRIRLFIGSDQDGREALGLVATKTLTVRRANLEDVFLKITGHNLRTELGAR